MNVRVIQPFVKAACSVISCETGERVRMGKINRKGESAASGEVTVILGVAGGLRGTVALMMPLPTALGLLQCMTGEPQDIFDNLGRSAIAEIANVISGTAATQLAADGHDMTISPPTVTVLDGDAQLSTVAIPIYAVDLETSCGPVELDLALAEAA